MSSPASPLSPLLAEINYAASHGMPLIAVVMAAALPDISVSLISDDGRTNGNRYKKWCEENLGDEFGALTSEDLWSMRCGVLHNGRFGDLKHQVSRVIFALPDSRNNLFINCRLNDAYFYSVVEFCRNFTAAVEEWFDVHREDEPVKANLPRLIQYREEGLVPYIKGMRVLA